tara:strand:- start:577 stop:954 length:378 start_codon:yes stop_codon:yes gene_type:complete
MMKRYIFIYLLIVTMGGMSFIFSENNYCEEPVNVWFKLSSSAGVQHVVELDMSKGRSFIDGPYIILEVMDRVTGEIIFIAFPNGGNWESETPQDPFLDELDKEFKNLEDYLRSKEGSQEIKKKQY